MAKKPKPTGRAKRIARSSFTRTFKVEAGGHPPPQLLFRLGRVGKYNLLNGTLIVISPGSGGPRPDGEVRMISLRSAEATGEETMGECVLGILQADLKEVDYSGDDLLVPEWRVDIHFEIVPHGVVTDTLIPRMAFDPDGKYTVLTPIFNGPGILCGQDCLPSTLIFHIQVTGAGGDGITYTGVADALFNHVPTPLPVTLNIGVKVKEPPLPPPDPPRPLREADLWFLFLVGTTC